ncbi:MAG: hypothetical protein NVSMB9_21240 [Isosphaeraceae bacterium]
MNLSITVEPREILGVTPGASLKEIHDAYRAKAKRYHPDIGGEVWAFRILSQAYETLTNERVVQVARRVTPTGPSAPSHDTPTSPFAAETGHSQNKTVESVSPGVSERAIDPAHVIDVEKLSVRYEADHVWLITERSSEHRFLSACLNITWPDPELGESANIVSNAEEVLRDLNEVFEAIKIHSQALSARCSVVGGRFNGWLSYPNSERASDAFNQFREMVHGHGLAVKQWSRDLLIPNQWR